MSQASPGTAVAATHSAAQHSAAPLSPVQEGRAGRERRDSEMARRSSASRRLSNGMEAVDTLIRSAVDAKRVLELVLSGEHRAQNLRQAVDQLVLPLLAALANCCACHAALTRRSTTSSSSSSSSPPHLDGLPDVTFDELGHRITLKPADALDGFMRSLTSSKPPMACYYGAKAPHVVHPAWQDPGAFSDDSRRGPLMTEEEVDAVVSLWADAAAEAEGSAQDTQWLMFNKIRELVEEYDSTGTASANMKWAVRLKEHIIKAVGQLERMEADVAMDLRLVWVHNNCVRLLHCLKEQASPALRGERQANVDLDSATPIHSPTSSAASAAAGQSFMKRVASSLVPLPERRRTGTSPPPGIRPSRVTFSSSSTGTGGQDFNVDAHHYVALDELAYQLSTASFVDIKEFKQEFDDLDVDGRGELNLQQFEQLMHRINIDIATKFVPYIFNKFDKNGNGLISYSEIISDYSVPKKAFIKFVNDKYEDVQHVRTLPLAIIYFFLFIYVSDFRELSGDLFFVTSAIIQRCLEQTEVFYEPEGRPIDFESIQSPDEFWYWLEYGFFPVFASDPSLGLSITNSSGFTVDENAFNVIVNSQVSLRQDRKAPTPCDPAYSVVIGATCFDRTTYGNATFGRALCEPPANESTGCFMSPPRPDLNNAFIADPPMLQYNFVVSEAIDALLESNFGTNLSMSLPQEQLRRQTSYLQGRHWIDSETAQVHMGVPLYNIATGAWANMVYSLQVADTGLWTTSYYYEVAVTGPYTKDKWYRWIPDVAWGLVLVTLVVVEVKSIVRHSRNPGKLGLCTKPKDADGRVVGRAYFRHGWNYFDWILIFMVYLQSIYWFVTLASQGPVIVEYVQSSDDADDVINIVGALGRSMWDYRIITVVTIMMWITRFFKSFMAQPRLAMITKAFRRSAEDLVHFAIVFILLLIGFMYMGTNLFGHELESFSNSFNAYWSLFYALVGEFEYEEALVVAPLWGTVFWFLYIFLMTLVVMNMLLAIIIEAYLAASKESVERHGQGKPPKLITMWDQIWSSLVNMYHTCRGSINLDQLVELLELIEADEFAMEVPFDNGHDEEHGPKSTVIELTERDSISNPRRSGGGDGDDDDAASSGGDDSDLHPAAKRALEAEQNDSAKTPGSESSVPTAADQRRRRALEAAQASPQRSPRSIRRTPRRLSSVGGGDFSDQLSLSDVTLALPRLMTFPPGEGGITAKKISMNFIFDIFREFVLTRQEPRNAQIDQMCRRINELDSDFQGMMESMDSLESVLHSIQRHQFKLMRHLDVFDEDDDAELVIEGAQLQHAAIQRAVSAGVIEAPFTAKSPQIGRIVSRFRHAASPKYAARSTAGWRSVARHMPLVPDRRGEQKEPAQPRRSGASLSTMGHVSMAMAKMQARRHTEAAVPLSTKRSEQDLLRTKLEQSKKHESFKDVMSASMAGLIDDNAGSTGPRLRRRETIQAHHHHHHHHHPHGHNSGKHSAAGNGGGGASAEDQIRRTGSYDVTKRLTEGFRKPSAAKKNSETLGIDLGDLEPSS